MLNLKKKTVLQLLAVFFIAIGITIFVSQKVLQNDENSQVSQLPDFGSIKDTNQKKQAFFDYIRKGVVVENKRIESERQVLLEAKVGDSSSKLQNLANSYKVNLPDNGASQEWLDNMLLRVNVLPEALVLTQAANESAWGTSRFAKKANNLFGQWCYSKGCGIVPNKRASGRTHEVQKFSSIQESIHGYFMNVNRNNAYQDLRTIRAKLNNEHKNLLSMTSAVVMTNGLLKYSERGQDYVNDLQAMLRHNKKFWTQ